MMSEVERLARLEAQVAALYEGISQIRTDLNLLREAVITLRTDVIEKLAARVNGRENPRAIIIQQLPWGVGGLGAGAILMRAVEMLTR